MSWIPTGDRVLIRYDEKAEQVSAGGVILSERQADEPNVVVSVVAVGRDAKDVVVGDRVLVSAFAGATLPEDELSRVIREGDVMAVVG